MASHSPSGIPERVTFVGIGAIGLPMATAVAAGGFEVTGVDFSAEQRAAAEQKGLQAAADAGSTAHADAVIVMVATADQLRAAVLGSGEGAGGEGLLARMRPGAGLIVMSTVGPEAVQDLVGPAAERGVQLVDAPVTGGIARAASGDLRLFVSGDPAAVESQQTLLESMGTVVSCGEQVGRGQSFKAVNQLLCAVHIVAGAEALALAEKLDLEPAEVLEAVSGGAAGSFMLSDRGPRMLEGLDAQVASAVSIFVKDSGLVSEIAESVGMEAPLLEAAKKKYAEAADAGWAGRDDSQVIQTYRG
ncbi:NAD(P)-dependent oxidoreductase [Nesterenkonia lacusekhoensis]|uniref:3-hydroxyisobutyrate dehydrogenase n=1 Tax=Nesterenkonia lacusekhoensis TaxID=150832 RepID=A0ABS4T3D4_9MICC|nr:NAD(P)-dependent oxidoreductase [Nesterenkonia lacusekhoensis]MBP2318947.1 3-hydroxyisobutyrate dehydrogenase [Nesterenkonia lacusekhoensis]